WHMAAVPLTFCEACRQYRAPWQDRLPAFCGVCGRPVTQPDRARIAADLDRICYLLDEVRAWSRAGLINGALGERLCGPYAAELRRVPRLLAGARRARERAAPPGAPGARAPPGAFCPDCGADLAAWRLQRAAGAAQTAEAALPAPPAPELAPAATPLTTST